MRRSLDADGPGHSPDLALGAEVAWLPFDSSDNPEDILNPKLEVITLGEEQGMRESRGRERRDRRRRRGRGRSRGGSMRVKTEEGVREKGRRSQGWGRGKGTLLPQEEGRGRRRGRGGEGKARTQLGEHRRRAEWAGWASQLRPHYKMFSLLW